MQGFFRKKTRKKELILGKKTVENRPKILQKKPQKILQKNHKKRQLFM